MFLKWIEADRTADFAWDSYDRCFATSHNTVETIEITENVKTASVTEESVIPIFHFKPLL